MPETVKHGPSNAEARGFAASCGVDPMVLRYVLTRRVALAAFGAELALLVNAGGRASRRIVGGGLIIQDGWVLRADDLG